MAKEDFCFTYYDGDAARDKAHMTRLQRGAYDDIISAQRKRGHLSVDDIKRVLSRDFDECWPALEWILKADADGKYFIEWLDNSLNKRKSWVSKSSDAGIRSARLREARKKGTHTKEEWYYLLAEAKGTCPRCKFEVPRFDKDHIIPLYQGGSDSIDNIQPLCAECNAAKGPEAIDYFKPQRAEALKKLYSTNLQPTSNQSINQNSTSNIGNEYENEEGIGFIDGGTGEEFEPDETEPFAMDPDLPLPASTLEAAELSQFALTRNKNTEHIQVQWGVFVAERIHDPPERRRNFRQLSDLTSYFLNWIRNKHPKNGTDKKFDTSGNSAKPGTSEARTKRAREW